MTVMAPGEMLRQILKDRMHEQQRIEGARRENEGLLKFMSSSSIGGERAGRTRSVAKSVLRAPVNGRKR